MDFKTEMAERTAQIEQIIKKYLPKEEGYQKTIMEAMNYSVLAGGKRLRPMLMQETYRLFGGRSEVIEPFMAATPTHWCMMIFRQWIMTNTAAGRRPRMPCTGRQWESSREMRF